MGATNPGVSPINHLPRVVSPRDSHASELLRQNSLKICESWRVGLLKSDFSVEDVDHWIAMAKDELTNNKAQIYVGVWQFRTEVGAWSDTT